ncbi:hypothetical protein [Rhodohalobacter sp. 8-1]|uniref:hypothetical protein n=1 Tax=Rhodohalobacter sp. 8-1 TaxID=3131972 RepID=UPI0030EC2EBE
MKIMIPFYKKRDCPFQIIIEGSGAIVEEVTKAKDYISAYLFKLPAQSTSAGHLDRGERDLPRKRVNKQ